jgi:hypothetical protein
VSRTRTCWRSSTRRGRARISFTDPDSRAIPAHPHVALGYNVQIAVDAEHKLNDTVCEICGSASMVGNGEQGGAKTTRFDAKVFPLPDRCCESVLRHSPEFVAPGKSTMPMCCCYCTETVTSVFQVMSTLSPGLILSSTAGSTTRRSHFHPFGPVKVIDDVC